MAETNLIPLNEASPFTSEEIASFEKQYLQVFKNLADTVKQKKALEDQEKKFKAQLEKVMDEFGIKSLDNQFIRITRVAENPGKMTIDLEKLEQQEPDLWKDLLKDYPKLSGKKKGYVKFDTK